MPILAFLIQFWSCHPAFLYGIAFMLGVLFHLANPFGLILPAFSLWLPLLWATFCPKYRDILKQLVLSLIIFLTGWIFTATYHTFPSLPPEGLIGMAHVKMKSISLQSNLFGKRWVYRCEIEQFFPDQESSSIASSLPCLLILPAEDPPKHPRPLANQEYWVLGKLVETEQESYLLKVSSRAKWIAIPETWSWAETRYGWKRKISNWVASQFTHSLSGSFLAGLVTGEFDDYWMRQQFSRFGVQHLLAISGFHFAIIAGFLNLFFRLFLSSRARILVLLLCLGSYCLFLGPQPSILRAWLMCSFTLWGALLEKQTTALNSLGVALLLILSYDPKLCQELGFQLSFATTAAILLFYSPAQAWLYELFPKRSLSKVLEMNRWNQHAYCILAFLRQGIALTIAVNIVALPLTLYYFQQFPSMSLLYNLFYPLLASGSICLFLLGSLFFFVPFLGEMIHGLNDHYTFFLLQLAYQIPTEMDHFFTMEPFDSFWLTFYLCVASLAGIVWKGISSKREQEEIFQFI